MNKPLVHYQMTLAEAREQAVYKWIDPEDFRQNPWMLCRNGSAYATGTRSRKRVDCPACLAKLSAEVTR